VRVLSKSPARYISSGASSRDVDSALEKRLDIWDAMVGGYAVGGNLLKIIQNSRSLTSDEFDPRGVQRVSEMG
jgi:hypothetical protein